MRSTGRTFLQLVLALALLLSVGALADDTSSVMSYEIDYCIPGNQYTFFAMEPGASISSPNGASLYYIDQLEANASEMLVAVVLADPVSYDVYVGGVFSNDVASPRRLISYNPDITMMPEDLEEIGISAFEGSAFTHVILGEKVTAIRSRAFANCRVLTYCYVPNSVETIEEDAFAESPNVVIGCHSGSPAAAFANQYGIRYRTLD